jgi:signal peptidase I
MEMKSFEHLGRDFRDTVLRLLRDYSEALILAILVAIILRMLVFGSYKVSNPTMEPSLKLGEFILAYKLPYGVALPFSDVKLGHGRARRGEILVFKCPHLKGQSCVKRVVGLPGDRIEIKNERLIVNGRAATYSASPSRPSDIILRQADFAAVQETSWGHSRPILVSGGASKVDFGPYVVPPGSFFALGDNRDFSEDSRHWGSIPFDAIEARALLVWLSIEWRPKPNGRGYSGGLRWSRLFAPIR